MAILSVFYPDDYLDSTFTIDYKNGKAVLPRKCGFRNDHVSAGSVGGTRHHGSEQI